jgi:acetate kinase
MSARGVLVVNTGSTSLRLAVVDGADVLAAEHLAAREDPAAAIEEFLRHAPAPAAAGHRVVHGGARFLEPTPVDDRLVAAIDELSALAPLHNPPALAAIGAVARLRPDLPAVACFDTAFHSTLPPAAATYPIPAEWRKRWPLRRFGFHGLSHAWVARRSAELLGARSDSLRIVSCHLGAGASLAAIAGGRSVDTTMGFTPLDGIMMATRAGSIDPGLVLWLIRSGGLAPAEVEDALEQHSGLTALAGDGDMREVEEAASAGDPGAELALAVYGHRLRAGIAAMAAALGGLDCLAFTGGVGESSPGTRAAAVDGLGFLGLGLALDPQANADPTPDSVISRPGTAAPVVVIQAREDLQIARETRAALGLGER